MKLLRLWYWHRIILTGHPCVATLWSERATVVLALVLIYLACVPVSTALAEQTNYAGSDGRALQQLEIEQLTSHAWPDGQGLPAGSGSAAVGKTLYENRCAGCHGSNGEGATALELVGDHASLSGEYPDRGIAAFWPYAPTLFEYVRRAMPPEQPFSLTVDETYAVVAYVLVLNGLLAPGSELDAAGLAAIELPNRNGFIDHFPEP